MSAIAGRFVVLKWGTENRRPDHTENTRPSSHRSASVRVFWARPSSEIRRSGIELIDKFWWAMQGSNLRPLQCGGRAGAAKPQTLHEVEARRGDSLHHKTELGHLLGPEIVFACYA